MGSSRRNLVDEIIGRHLAEGDEEIISASDVARYVSSDFAFYCDLFAPESERDEDADSLAARRARGIAHEEEMIKYATTPVPYTTFEEGFHLTVDMMTDGIPAMYNAPLISKPVGMVGKPDQLLKVDGVQSIFGNYCYRVVEVKSHFNLRREHMVQAAFYNRLLGLIQEIMPETFTMLDGKGNEIILKAALSEYFLDKAIGGTRNVLSGYMPAPVYRQTAPPWGSFGDKIAQADLTRLYQVGYPRRQALVEGGYYTIDDVASADETDIARLLKLKIPMTECVVAHAKAIRDDMPIVVRPVQLPSATAEIFLDMEHMNEGVFRLPDSWNGFLNYLTGVVVKSGMTQRYIPFFADAPNDEEECWRKFCDLLESCEDLAVYYWSTSAEKVYMRKLLDRYGASPSAEQIMANAIDLFTMFTSSIAIPSESYRLKDIAKYLGFHWNLPGHDGLWAMLKYIEYTGSHDAEIRNEILTYNEDDCRALMHIKDWLVENSP